MPTVHSALPAELSAAVDAVLRAAGVEHVAHGRRPNPMPAAEAAAADPDAIALLGPYRSRAVADALEATAPAGLALLAPVATWAGVTRDDEPGCDSEPARHRGTVLRMIARDTVVAARLAADVRAAGQRALVVAGEHEYGAQLDGQLRLAELPRARDAADADLVVLCGLAGELEVTRAAAAGLPVIAFDGVQDGRNLPDLRLALPFAPGQDMAGSDAARRAAELIVDALGGGAGDRATVLAAMRVRGPFDEHGDPVDPPVWLWRPAADWTLEPDRSL
jgi:hypothetical protein